MSVVMLLDGEELGQLNLQHGDEDLKEMTRKLQVSLRLVCAGACKYISRLNRLALASVCRCLEMCLMPHTH